jgi:hypothetical protein
MAKLAAFPHQKQALQYTEGRRKIALFMEMRLGKSMVTIRWAKAQGLKRVLLIGPLTTLLGETQWEGALKDEGVTDIVALPRVKKNEWHRHYWTWTGMTRRRRPGWFLIHYEALLNTPEILSQPWDGIVVDESTRIRNPKAKLTKLLHNQTAHIRCKAILSGLPNPEAPADFFCQFKFLFGRFMKHDNYWAWKQSYFHQPVDGLRWMWRPNPGTRERISKYVHKNAFILQRKTAGVGSNKVRTQVRVKMTRTQKQSMKEMQRDYALADRETKWVTVIHQWAQQLAGGWHPTLEPKELLSDLKLRALAKIVSKRKPAVVWFRFNHEIEGAYHYLIQHVKGLRVAYVHGAMKDSKPLRVQYQEAFQKGKLDVLLLQVKLGKYGWNLSRSSLAIYYSNSYEFEDRSQSEDRIIHLTKTEDCHYIDLVTIGSTDEDVVEAIYDKRITARQFNRRVKAATIKRICQSPRTGRIRIGKTSTSKVGSSSTVRASRYANSGTGRSRAATHQPRLF